MEEPETNKRVNLERLVETLVFKIRNNQLTSMCSEHVLILSRNNFLGKCRSMILAALQKCPITLENYQIILALALEYRANTLIWNCFDCIESALANKEIVLSKKGNYSFDVSVYSENFFEVERDIIQPLFEIYEKHVGTPPGEHGLHFYACSQFSTSDLLKIAKTYRKQLRILHLLFRDMDENSMCRLANLCDNLEELWIEGRCYSQKALECLGNFRSLKKLYFHEFDQFDDLCIHNIPSLETLDIFQVQRVKNIRIINLPRLKRLEVFASQNIREIALEKTPLLNEVTLSNCDDLRKLIIDKQLPYLSQLRIIKCKNFHNLFPLRAKARWIK